MRKKKLFFSASVLLAMVGIFSVVSPVSRSVLFFMHGSDKKSEREIFAVPDQNGPISRLVISMQLPGGAGKNDFSPEDIFKMKLVLGVSGFVLLFYFFSRFYQSPKKDPIKERIEASQMAGISGGAGLRGLGTRRFDRVPVSIPVFYSTENSGRVKATVIDINLDGAAILCPELIEKETRVEIFFKQDGNNDELKIAGKVMFIGEQKNFYKIGVRFFHLFRHQEDFINQMTQNPPS